MGKYKYFAKLGAVYRLNVKDPGNLVKHSPRNRERWLDSVWSGDEFTTEFFATAKQIKNPFKTKPALVPGKRYRHLDGSVTGQYRVENGAGGNVLSEFRVSADAPWEPSLFDSTWYQLIEPRHVGPSATWDGKIRDENGNVVSE